MSENEDLNLGSQKIPKIAMSEIIYKTTKIIDQFDDSGKNVSKVESS